MAWCLCDECEYRKECKYYRKVVVCPYMLKEEIIFKYERKWLKIIG